MKQVLVLGGGTAGTMVVNQLHKKLAKDQWQITVVDETNSHIYQPGLLLLPFGVYTAEEIVKQRDHFFPKGVNFIQKAIENYKKGAEKDPNALMRTRSLQYLVAAYGPDKLNDPSQAEPLVHLYNIKKTILIYIVRNIALYYICISIKIKQ